MDNFVKELTDALADYPEDVILVMYGDHLPTMGLTVEDLKNKYLFQTQYVMWDNFGLEKKDENLAAYQMAAEVMGPCRYPRRYDLPLSSGEKKYKELSGGFGDSSV